MRPLPLWERAAGRFNNEGWVRGKITTPHPTELIDLSTMPSPTRGEGKNGKRLTRGKHVYRSHKNRFGHIMVRHMCDAGELSKPRPSSGWRKLRPTMSTKSSRFTFMFGSNE